MKPTLERGSAQDIFHIVRAGRAAGNVNIDKHLQCISSESPVFFFFIFFFIFFFLVEAICSRRFFDVRRHVVYLRFAKVDHVI